jgi:UDP-glucose:glycoprotein glucosyltransferase
MNLIGRNLNNVVFVLDLSQPAALALLTNNVRQFISRGIPVRFGVVPQVGAAGENGNVSTMVAQVLWYLVEAVGRAPAMGFCGDVRLRFASPSISQKLNKPF